MAKVPQWKKKGEESRWSARQHVAKNYPSLAEKSSGLDLILGLGGAVTGGILGGGNPSAIMAGWQGGKALGGGIEGLTGAKTAGEAGEATMGILEGAGSATAGIAKKVGPSEPGGEAPTVGGEDISSPDYVPGPDPEPAGSTGDPVEAAAKTNWMDFFVRGLA